jgi:hypothetical protein
VAVVVGRLLEEGEVLHRQLEELGLRLYRVSVRLIDRSTGLTLARSHEGMR